MVVPRRIELLSNDYQSLALPLSYETIIGSPLAEMAPSTNPNDL